MFRAKYDGECAFCGAEIEKGDWMGVTSGENAEGYEVSEAPACEICCRDLEGWVPEDFMWR